MAATGKVIGTVTAVVGEAKATAADGTVRILQVGDKVYSDEAIATSEAGSINIALEGGKTLACDGGAELALHESLLNVANAPASSEVDAIQRAIAAGQDPSQVAAATAAGGAPAAGGDVDGGMHEPVILEQSNSASVVTSGFETEGGSLAYSSPETESQGDLIVASVSEAPDSEQEASSPVHPVFESLPSVQFDAPAVVDVVGPEISVELPETAQAPVVTEQAEETPLVIAEQPANDEIPFDPVVAIEDVPPSNADPVVVETNQEEQNAQPPVVIDQAEETPVVTVEQPSDEEIPADPVVAIEDTPPSNEEPVVVADETPPASEEPVVVADETPPANEEPVVVVDETPPSEEPVVVADETPPANEEPVVVETGDEGQSAQPPVVDEQPEEPVVVIPTEDTPPETPESSSPVASSIGYSISANTNQDEQIGFLTFSNNGHEFKTLIFFGQEGQQKPTAVQLSFTLDHDQPLVVQLEYVDAFAGNSDAGTGKTAQKIAIKDFSLDIDGTNVVLAQESDGLNIGMVGKKSQMVATVEVDMNGTPSAADDTAGDWTFGNDGSVNSAQAIDLVDGGALDLSGVDNLATQNYEVINLKGADAQQLTLSAQDVLQAADESKVLHIVGGKEDTLNLTSDEGQWTVVDGDNAAAGTQASYFGWVQVHHTNGATLLVDPDVQINPMG